MPLYVDLHIHISVNPNHSNESYDGNTGL